MEKRSRNTESVVLLRTVVSIKFKITVDLPQLLCFVVLVAQNGKFQRFEGFCVCWLLYVTTTEVSLRLYVNFTRNNTTLLVFPYISLYSRTPLTQTRLTRTPHYLDLELKPIPLVFSHVYCISKLQTVTQPSHSLYGPPMILLVLRFDWHRWFQ